MFAREKSPAVETSLFRNAAMERVSSAEPLDELVTLPTMDGRVTLLVLALLLLIVAVALSVIV